MSIPRDALIRFAEQIEPERARQLGRDFGQSAGSGVAVALASAFEQFYPRTEWQRAGLAQIEQEGWRVPRTRAESFEQLLNRWGERQPIEAVLRRGAWVERARIALRELLPHTLGGAPLLVTTREISWLAESLIELALKGARAHAVERFGEPHSHGGAISEFVVLGLGKLGGLELNAGSDVDLCFVYDTDDSGTDLSLHEFWSRVARSAVRSLDAPTEDGIAWRVDLRLRPEGSQGAVCNSLGASERYYETWGRLWERAALVRARPVAGSSELGYRFMTEVAGPFVYQRKVDPSIANSLAQLLALSRVELHTDSRRDLKLGVGGIREAEFFVQALQLIWGGRDKSLQVPGIFPALERLQGAGLVSEREARLFSEAYTLLRTVEHRIQWQTGIQTHSLPRDPEQLVRLARTLGISNPMHLLTEIERAQNIIAEAYASLGEGTTWPSSRYLGLFALVDRVNSPHTQDTVPAADSTPPPPLGTPILLPRLARAALSGSTQPKDSEVATDLLEHYAMLARRPDDILGSLTRERHPQLVETLLDAISQCPDPEQAALGLRVVFGRINHAAVYFSALADDERAVRRLVTALAASPFIVDTLASRPDAIDIVMASGGRIEQPQSVLIQELRSMEAARDVDRYERLDAVVGALRRAKSRLFVEVMVADLSGSIELHDARRTLSELADASLEQAARAAFDGAPRGLGIVALGKLGACDLGYGSDLDVIFVYDPALAPDPLDAQEFYVRRAQRIIRLISAAHPAGPGYELDVRLRPSGSQGMLVTSLDAFASYHGVARAGQARPQTAVATSGAAWERQVLLRARACAGDRDVAERAVQLANNAAYTLGPPDAHELHRLRLRMQRELACERAGRFDLKSGAGGLLDIEFATQWLQMLHGGDERVRTTNTEDALVRLQSAGYLARQAFQVFRDGYIFLRQLEQRLFIIHGQGTTAFDMQSSTWPQLARRMRLQDSPRAPGAELLRSRYMDVTQAIRETYEQVLGVGS